MGIIFYFSRVLKQIQGFQVQQISSFWSHSWHGGHWQKILTLLMLYNGPASVLVGSLVAFLMTLLFSLGLLPGFIRDPVDFGHVVWSTWALVSGFVASMVTFFFWRSQRLVFFDRMCIPEDDEELKQKSIVSLAGFLKQSREMLVLWDSTWSSRLWCHSVPQLR